MNTSFCWLSRELESAQELFGQLRAQAEGFLMFVKVFAP
jgi:hypothetical protein